MNFRWSNIYVLQYLLILNVNGLKLVPADRKVIKQNGTTRTISRYYLLPQGKDATQLNLDSTGSNEGDFSKLLREFHPQRDVKNKTKQEPKKKTIERYRIYIKRKLKKPKTKLVSKLVSPSGKDNNQEGNHFNSNGKPPKYIKTIIKRIPIHKTKTTTTYDDSEDEYILKNKNAELSAAYPTYVLGQKVKGEDDIKDLEEEETVLRSHDSGSHKVEENNMNQTVEQGSPETAIESTKVITKKVIYGVGQQSNHTRDMVSKSSIQVGQGGSFTVLTKNGSSDEINNNDIPTSVRSKITRLPQNGGLNQTHLDQLYKEIYEEYHTEATAKPDDNDYKYVEEPYIEEEEEDIENAKLQKLLSTLHNTSEYVPGKVPHQVNNDSDSNNYFYKNPIDAKDSTDTKSTEISYDVIENDNAYNLNNPIPIDSGEITAQKSIELTEKQNSSTLVEYINSQGRTANPLENYFQTFHNHNTLLKESTLNVESIETDPNSTSNGVDGTNLTKIFKYLDRKRKPLELEESFEYIGPISSPIDSTNNQTDDKYLETTTIPLNYNGTGYSKTARSPLSSGYSRESSEYLENILDTPKSNGTKKIIEPLFKDYELVNIEGLERTSRPYILNNQTDAKDSILIKKLGYKYFNPANIENTITVNRSLPQPLHNQQHIKNEQENLHFLGNNHTHTTDIEYIENIEIPSYNNNKLANGTKHSAPLGHYEENFEHLETADSVPLDDNLTDYEYSKVKHEVYNTTNNSKYDQDDLKYLESIKYPFTSELNKTDIDYSEIINKTYQTRYNTSNTDSPSYSPEYLENAEGIRYPPSLNYNITDSQYFKPVNHSKNEKFDPASTERSGTTTNPLITVYNQSTVENRETVRYPPYLDNYQIDVEYIKNENSTYNDTQANNKQSETEINPPSQYENDTVVEYIENVNEKPLAQNTYERETEYYKPPNKDYIPFTNEQSKPFQDDEKPESTKIPPSEDLADEYPVYIKYPVYIGYNQTSTEYAKTVRIPAYMGNNYYSENINKSPYPIYNSETSRSPYLNDDQAYAYYTKTVRTPPYIGYYQEDIKYRDTIKPPLDYDHENNSEIAKLPSPKLVEEIILSEHMNKPVHPGHNINDNGYAKVIKHLFYTGHNQSNNEDPEYSEHIKHPSYINIQSVPIPYVDYNEASTQYSITIRSPPYIGQEYFKTYKDSITNIPSHFNEGSIKYIQSDKNPSYLGYNPDNDEYFENTLSPPLVNNEQVYTKNTANTVRSPPNIVLNQSPSIEHSYDTIHPGMYHQSQDNSETFRLPPYGINYPSRSTEHPESSRFSPYEGPQQWLENEYSEYTQNPLIANQHPSQIKGYSAKSKVDNSPVHNQLGVLEYSENFGDLPLKVHHGDPEYLVNAKTLHNANHNQFSNVKYLVNLTKPSYGVPDQLSNTEYANHLTNPSYVIPVSHKEYSGDIIKPFFANQHQPSGTYYYKKSKNPQYTVYYQSPSVEYSENTRNPLYVSSKSNEYFENSDNQPYSIYNQGSNNQYLLENPKNPTYVVQHQLPNIQYFQTPRKPVNAIDSQLSKAEYIKTFPFSSYNKYTNNEYLEDKRTHLYASNQVKHTKFSEDSSNAPYIVYHKSPSTKYSENSRYPSYVVHNKVSSTEFPSNSRVPPYFLHHQLQNINYNDNSKIPPYAAYDQALSTEFSEISRNPPPVTTSEQLISAVNIETSSVSQVFNIYENSTEDAGQRDVFFDDWSIYKDIVPGHQHSRKPKIQIGTNLIQIGTGNEAISRPEKSIDLASLCPECFKKISSNILNKILENSFSNLNIQGDYPLTSPEGIPMQNSQNQNVMDYWKKLDNQNQQQAIYLNPDKDQSLYKVLELIMKGDAEAFSGNVQGLTTPSIQLFTIDNLKNVLLALERNPLTNTIIETANLYKIIKLIFEIAQQHIVAASGSDDLWYTQLNSAGVTPLKTYVYNLLQQKWLQEIMLQLVNNNYNLNVIRNPRSAAYLGAWTYPVELLNYNTEYFDQNQIVIKNTQVGGGDFYNNLASINLQGDAGAILGFLQKYLFQTQSQFGHSILQYYQRQHEILRHIAAFLRERRYPLHVIENLIRQLYAALNAPRAQVITATRAPCVPY